MEKLVFDQICARLQDATVTAWIAAQVNPAFAAIKTIDWFTDHVQDLLDKGFPDGYPIDFPAVLVEFGEVTYDIHNSNKQKGSGEVTLHIVNSQIGKDGRVGASTISNFKDMIAYKDMIINVFDGFKASTTGSSRFILKTSKMDQMNRPIRDDKVVLKFTAVRRKPSAMPGFPT